MPAFRRFITSKLAVYLLLAAVGLGMFGLVLTYLPPASTVGDSARIKAADEVGKTAWKDFALVQKSPWWVTVLTSIATIMITVSIFELLKAAVEHLISVYSAGRAFDAFFGDGASHSGRQGVVILQAAQIDVLAETLLPGFRKSMSSGQQNRFFKARTWINRWDAEGAKAIRETFQRLGYNPPELRHIDLNETINIGAEVPFEISMGLGFADETTRTVTDVCKPWMRISQTELGDAIELKNQLVPDTAEQFEKIVDGEFTRLLPKSWKLDAWLENPEEVRDYAIILRHTRRQGNYRQVLFLVAGFTERGTAAAGQYLAAHWHELWSKHVKGSTSRRGLGDFLVVIEGPSVTNDISKWGPDPNLLSITPYNLFEPYRIPCEWSKRYGNLE
jgi:hypothetical protein